MAKEFNIKAAASYLGIQEHSLRTAIRKGKLSGEQRKERTPRPSTPSLFRPAKKKRSSRFQIPGAPEIPSLEEKSTIARLDRKREEKPVEPFG